MWTTRLYFHKLSSSWFSFVKYKLSFSFLDSILMLYICLVTSNLQYVYIAWNSTATTEANRPSTGKFLALFIILTPLQSRVWFGLLKSSFFMLVHGGVLMRFFLLLYAMTLKSVLPFLILLAFIFLLFFRRFHCLLVSPCVKRVLLHAQQLYALFAEMWTNLVQTYRLLQRRLGTVSDVWSCQ
jgi:hypothetical protein